MTEILITYLLDEILWCKNDENGYIDWISSSSLNMSKLYFSDKKATEHLSRLIILSSKNCEDIE